MTKAIQLPSRSYDEFLERGIRRYGSAFNPADLCQRFIPAYESQERITVEDCGEVKRGRVGVTTGWKPCFLLMLTIRSQGSSITLGPKTRIVG